MLLSDLYVMTVSLPADLASNQRGKGAILKFRFSPYTQIELLRVAMLKVSVCICECIRMCALVHHAHTYVYISTSEH